MLRGRAMRWSVLLVLLLAVALAALMARAQEAQGQAGDAVAPVAEATLAPKVPDFEPTDEWQDILPGQAVPPGLHVRLNLATGKREAKLLSEEDAALEAAQQPAAVEDAASVTVTTDVTGDIKAATTTSATHALAVVEEPASDETRSESTASATDAAEGDASEDTDEAPPAREPNWNHEKIYEVLEALPEPPSVEGMDIHEARAKLSEPEFRRQMIKLWKKRQEELKEAVNSLQDDAKYLAKLLEDFREAETNGDTEGQLRVLEVLEWEVQDLDKTHVFNFIGGFGIMTEYLNSTNLPVRASASWLIGTAVKNYKDGQDWAINAGAIPRLVDSLSLPVPADNTEAAASVFEVKKKAVYALSSLARFNARAQRLLLSLEGPEKLSQLMDAAHPLGVQLKAVLFVHDLLFEEPAHAAPTGGDEDALGQLHEAFQSSVWCTHTARFLLDNAAKLQRNQQAETVQAMLAQLPTCKPEFVAANVKPTIERLAATWQNDADVESDERGDLAVVGSAILSAL